MASCHTHAPPPRTPHTPLHAPFTHLPHTFFPTPPHILPSASVDADIRIGRRGCPNLPYSNVFFALIICKSQIILLYLQPSRRHKQPNTNIFLKLFYYENPNFTPPPIARLLLAILMCLPICGSRLSAQEPYAVYNEATSTLTFKYGTKPAGAYALNEGNYTPDWYKCDYNNDYYNTNIITKVVFDASFANARPTSCYCWFYGCKDLTTIEGIENLNTENVTNMGSMFRKCPALTTLDLSSFNTQNVTDMSYMFFFCTALKTLNLSNFDTQNVTSMRYMFCSCKNLTTLDVSKFNTKNVANMDNMFTECFSLTTLDVSNFDTQNVANMSGMFLNSYKLTTLDLSSFNTQNVTNISDMFWGCKALTTLDLSNFDTKNVTYMSSMFRDCSALTTLDIANFDTKNVTDMSSMFRNCSVLTTLDIANFDTKNVTNMSDMFYRCEALATLDLSNFDTKNVTDMRYMFYQCYALTTIYASDKYVTTACDYDDNMFAFCTNLVGAVPYDKNKVGKEMANYTTGYFTYKAATGIDAPTVSDDTAAEYYDLQGRRLNAPQKGVNIVKRGNKTTKMLVK